MWDLRFGLPVKTWRHPTKRRIRKLAHKEDAFVVAAADSDDVMIWDVNSNTVVQLFSVLPAGAEAHPFMFSADPNKDPPMDYGTDDLLELQSWSERVLSDNIVTTPEALNPAGGASGIGGTQSTSSSFMSRGPAPIRTTALYCTKDTVFTGSNDCCMRLWETTPISDTQIPQSYTVCGPGNSVKEQYSAMRMECSVVQQASSALPTAASGSGLSQSSGSRPVMPDTHRCHHDAILDIAAVEQPTPKILTAGRDGVIKVWK